MVSTGFIPLTKPRLVALLIYMAVATTVKGGNFDNYPARPLRTSPPPAKQADLGLLWHGAHDERLVISGSDRELTRSYRLHYSTDGGIRWLETVLQRAAIYLPHIRARLASYNLPPELAYLPVIESAFLPTALSSSGAAGLWQFMKNSIAPFGLRIDDWVDERRDFWLATEAALRKLKENYDYFKDWPLALAAYNAGLGAVQRAIQNSGIKDYWTLCEQGWLKSETVQYVPKLLAVAEVASQAGRLGLTIDWPEPAAWTRLALERSVDLNLLAEYSAVPLERLRAGNAELHYDITPAAAGYYLKILETDVPAIKASLARNDIQLIHYYQHLIRSGDTLSALARHYSISVESIEKANPGVQARFLKLGQTLLIPALKEVGPYQREKTAGAITFSGQYTVGKGDTLWSIGLKFNTDPEVLAAANNMELSDILREGRIIKTPVVIAELP